MKSKKIFILLTDGVGLRNFAFGHFVEIGKKMGWDVVFWNQTPFDLKKLALSEIRCPGKPKAVTDLLKRAKINVELDIFEEKFKDPVYREYKFPPSGSTLKAKIKNKLVSFLSHTFRGEKGLQRLRGKLRESERSSEFYRTCKSTLEQEKPDLLFCTNQRAISALAPILAATDLNIPTASFIFSWDNLPKATMVLETDHYFVWSDYMKMELMGYYPFIHPEQILVTGSPQFEPHFDKSLQISKEDFFKNHGLDASKKYLCFSGDDSTTSPHDELYLRDVAEAVKKINSEGQNLGIIFRRCPVDLSNRYEWVLKEFPEIIVAIAPLWEEKGKTWNAILPTQADLKLLANLMQHSFMVINIASSMVFDAVCHGKPCAYINYNPQNINLKKDTPTMYNYVHFRSMPTKKAVLWINSKENIEAQILKVLDTKSAATVLEAQDWFGIINKPYANENASKRIWKEVAKI